MTRLADGAVCGCDLVPADEAIRLLSLAGVLSALGGTMASGQSRMQSKDFPAPTRYGSRAYWEARAVERWIRAQGEREPI